jgi:hypothetical protein
MATKLYLHNVSNAVSGTFPAGEQSALNTASFTATGANTLKTMDLSLGSVQSTLAGTSLANTTQQYGFMGFFSSPELKGNQTVGGGTWTINHAQAESSLNMNFFINIVNIYVWRPSTNTKIGTIKDSTTSLGGLEPSVINTERVNLFNFTTSQVSALDGDVIICELWSVLTQATVASNTATIYFDGTTENTTQDAVVTSQASYLNITENLTFYNTRYKKSIKVPVNFGAVADLTSSTTVFTTIGTPTINIPENATSRVTITSALLMVAAQDTSTVGGGSISVFQASCQLTAAGAATTVAISSATLANSGENWGGLFGPFDFTSHFQTNFGVGGTSVATTGVGINISTGTGTAIRGVYAYYEITYTYDSSVPSRVHFVGISYDNNAVLGTVNTSTVATLPQLTGSGGLLSGYTNVAVTRRWIEVKGNDYTNNVATALGLSTRFDNLTATITLPVRVTTLITDTWQLYQIDASALTTTATHTFQLWSALASRWNNIVITEFVEFTYDVAGTTRILNYIEFPVEFTSPIAGTTSAVSQDYVNEIWVQEPNVLLLNSAIEISYSSIATATANFFVGSQSSRAYLMTSPGLFAGMNTFQHRFDSGAAAGAGITFVRGLNTIKSNIFVSIGSMYNTSGVGKLLYASDVPSSGLDNQNHVIYSLERQMSFTTTQTNTVSDNLPLPNPEWWRNSFGQQHHVWVQGVANTVYGFNFQVQKNTTDYGGVGWGDMYLDFYQSDGELSYCDWNVGGGDLFKRWPNDTNLYTLDFQSVRNYKTNSTIALVFGNRWLLSYHTITYEVSGSITNSNGGSINIDVYYYDGTETTYFDTTQVTGNASFSFLVYDDTVQWYVTAYESALYKGMSKVDVAGTGFDISLSSGSVTTGYASG